MTAHLSDSELTEHLLGNSNERVAGHLGACEACRKELESVAASIHLYREMAQVWTDQDAQRAVSKKMAGPGIQRNRRAMIEWALAAAAIVLVALPAIHYAHKPPSTANTTATVAESATTAEIASDNKLLEQIDNEMSEAVPTPMQSLQVSGTSK